MFRQMKYYVHPAKLSKTRHNIFRSQVMNHGGEVVESYNKATHVIIEETCDVRSLPISLWSTERVVAGSLWLSNCLKRKELISLDPFIVTKPSLKRKSPSPITIDENQLENESKPGGMPAELKKFKCAHPSVEGVKDCNMAVLKQLQKLADVYKSIGDQWRAHGYEKAISSLRQYGKEIKCREDISHLDGVGVKMASKVMEIISTGKLRKVDELCNSEQSKVVEMFTNIWGAGPTTAEGWYFKGHRTLDDLKENEKLTKQQTVGVTYYDEFLERMTRMEVEAIGNKVTQATLEVERSLATVLCGSYRRGKTTCGDVDVVVIKPDKFNSKEILLAVLSKLKASGFVTDDLMSLEKSGNQRKYLGVCKLPGDENKHRRLDIFVVPQSESACAIMHYTGSAVFNRSIRQLAASKGMHLSEQSLSAGVVRQGTAILNEGHTLLTPTEKSIFEHLDLKYRPPEERDH